VLENSLWAWHKSTKAIANIISSVNLL